MSIPLPRFTGRAIEIKDGWTWELIISVLGDPNGDIYSTKDVFKTKEDAIKQLNEAIEHCIQSLARDRPELGLVTDSYIDIKTNETKSWKKE